MKVGVDCPFGWPVGFVDAVLAHDRRRPWPGGSGDDARRQLRYRVTDRDVAERFPWPLSVSVSVSVSSSMIAVLTMRWAAIVDRWHDAGHEEDRLGLGHLVEVYPAAALRFWERYVEGYKNGDHWLAARRSMLDGLRAHVDLDPWFDVVIADQSRGDDPIDALVAALVAGAAATPDGVDPPPARGTSDRQAAEVEGWIAIPRIGIGDIRPERSGSTG